MEPGRDPAGAQGARAMASPDAVSFYCHTCAARLELPAPSSPFHFTLCPRCRRDYLDDSPDPHRVPWPPAPFTPSTPPPPPPIPCVSSPSSSFTTARPRTLVPPRTGPSSSSTGPPPATSSGSAASPTAPVSSCCPERSAACREFRLLCEQRRSSPAVSTLSSPYSTACSSPLLASPPPPPPPPFHRGDGDLLSESFPLTLRSSTGEEAMSPPHDLLPPPPPPLFHRSELLSESFPLTSRSSTAEEATSPPHHLLPPPPPPWLPLASAGTWDEFLFNPSDSDDDSPPQPPPPPPDVSPYHAMFDMPLQVQSGVSQAAAASIAANDTVFEFDAPLQRGGSQAAPPESIAALPTVTVTEAGLDCVVCTDPLPPSAPARRLPCGHQYHSHCIVKWLSENNSCPICRRSIPTITSATSDVASSSSSSSSQSPGGRRRRSLPVPGGRRIRRICSRLLRNMEIGRDRQTSSSRDRQTNSSGGDVHV